MANLIVPGLKMRAFNRTFPPSLAGINYVLPESRAVSGLDIWSGIQDPSAPSITTLEVQSGGGKTTLANALFDYLADPVDSTGPFFWDGSLVPEYEVSMMPQQPSMVLHWKVSDLVPKNSAVLDIMFGGDDIASFSKRHLSELSGGQRARVLLASSIEHVLISKAKVYFLILDEALEGVDASQANIVMRNLIKFLTDAVEVPHLRLLIINHFDPSTFLAGFSSRRLALAPVSRTEVLIKNDTYSFLEVLVDEAA